MAAAAIACLALAGWLWLRLAGAALADQTQDYLATQVRP